MPHTIFQPCKMVPDGSPTHSQLTASLQVSPTWTPHPFSSSLSAPLSSFSPDPPGQLDILGHDRHPLRVDRTQVGVLEEPHQVRLRSFLQCQHCRRLESQVGLVFLRDLANQPLEGQLADEQLGRLLVFSDFSQGHGSRPVPVRLLDSTGGGCGFSGGFGGQLLSGGFASGGLSCGLLCSGHGAAAQKGKAGRCGVRKCGFEQVKCGGKQILAVWDTWVGRVRM